MKNVNRTENVKGVRESHLAKKNDLKIQASPLLRFSVSLALSFFIIYTLLQIQTTLETDQVITIVDVIEDNNTYMPVFKEEIVVVRQITSEPMMTPTIIIDKLTVVDNDTKIKDQVLATSTKPKEVTSLVDTKDVFVAEEDNDDDIVIPFTLIEDVPIYPGCENYKNNRERRACMSEMIQKHVNKQFNTNLAKELGLDKGIQYIHIVFMIDENGNVTEIQSRAPHPKLKKEAERILRLLPKMEPGKQRGKNVKVKYTLPIIFRVD